MARGLRAKASEGGAAARKFIVEFADGAFGLAADARRCPGTCFAGRADAIVFASDRARDSACGAVGLVVVKAERHELHCITPGEELVEDERHEEGGLSADIHDFSRRRRVRIRDGLTFLLGAR